MLPLETERLKLRRWSLDDADAYYEAILSDADVMRYLPGGVPRPREAAERSIRWFNQHAEEHGFSLWAVEEKSTGALVGNCGLVHIPNAAGREVEVAYTLAKAFWGRGMATEAARASVQYGFEECELDEIYGLAFPPNEASQNVLRKIGMTYEGVHPEVRLIERPYRLGLLGASSRDRVGGPRPSGAPHSQRLVRGVWLLVPRAASAVEPGPQDGKRPESTRHPAPAIAYPRVLADPRPPRLGAGHARAFRSESACLCLAFAPVVVGGRGSDRRCA